MKGFCYTCAMDIIIHGLFVKAGIDRIFIAGRSFLDHHKARCAYIEYRGGGMFFSAV